MTIDCYLNFSCFDSPQTALNNVYVYHEILLQIAANKAKPITNLTGNHRFERYSHLLLSLVAVPLLFAQHYPSLSPPRLPERRLR